MKATDARRHTPDQLKLLRERAFAMRREGFPVPSICKVLGVGRSTVFKWFKIAKSTSEEEAINGGKRGRPQGVGAKLTRQQEAQVRQWLIDKNPWQMMRQTPKMERLFSQTGTLVSGFSPWLNF